jgi:3-deoxy-D-manno-octulosonate 8-phosphate phosphatase (KDO 8-P phosphatase)
MIPLEVARRIRLVGLDVDGVMTDGGIYLGEVAGQRLEFKRYDIQDGMGIALLQKAGIRVAIATGRVSESVRYRAKELNIEDVAQDPDGHKLIGFQAILAKHKIPATDVAFVGDDFPDLPILRLVGLPVAVGNAVAEIRAVTTLHLKASGGHGAIREFAELLLKARGEWTDATDAYVSERSGGGR